METAGQNNTTLKHQNRGLILRLLCSGKCTSRIEIARETGLSKMAATNIINEFVKEGIVVEGKLQRAGKKGRSPVTLELADTAPKVIGIHINRNKCGVSLCDLKLNIIDGGRFSLTEENYDRMFEMIFEILDGILEKYKNEKILGIGIGALGPVSVLDGMILDPPNFFGMKNIHVRDIVKKRYDLPVLFEHEYDCAALTELYFGEGRDLKNFYFLGISWGVGGGAILNGGLYRNEVGSPTEIGHMCINYNGPVCNCGRHGCLETYISSLRIREKLKEATGEDLSFEEFCKRYEYNAPDEVDRVFREMAVMLAYGITNVVNLSGTLNYIIGHEGCLIPDRYLKDCERLVNERMMFKNHGKARIIKSKLHDEVLSSTCACAIIEKLFIGEAEEFVFS